MCIRDRPESEVTVTSSVDESSSCVVAVHNMGTPIPAQVQSVLFQPMVRGPGEVQAGSSVGLDLRLFSSLDEAVSWVVA